jgi:RNA polymerase sigma factor (sigma-70 family)
LPKWYTNQVSTIKTAAPVNIKEQFTAAIKEHEGFIYKIASVYTNTAEDKNDLVQEIIYQLWKSFGGFEQRSGTGTWMYRVALNVAIYQLKKSKKRIPTVPVEEYNLNQPDKHDTVREEQWQLLKQQLEKLNLLDKAIVMLYLDNKSYDEIAAVIGISKTNVGTKLQRIKDKLKKQLKNT